MSREYSKGMIPLGVVESVDGKGGLVFRSSSMPEHGSAVYDINGKKIGVVSRIFGPVDSPYATVTGKNDLEKLIGTNVFLRGERTDGKTERRNRRNRGMY